MGIRRINHFLQALGWAALGVGLIGGPGAGIETAQAAGPVGKTQTLYFQSLESNFTSRGGKNQDCGQECHYRQAGVAASQMVLENMLRQNQIEDTASVGDSQDAVTNGLIDPTFCEATARRADGTIDYDACLKDYKTLKNNELAGLKHTIAITEEASERLQGREKIEAGGSKIALSTGNPFKTQLIEIGNPKSRNQLPQTPDLALMNAQEMADEIQGNASLQIYDASHLEAINPANKAGYDGVVRPEKIDFILMTDDPANAKNKVRVTSCTQVSGESCECTYNLEGPKLERRAFCFASGRFAKALEVFEDRNKGNRGESVRKVHEKIYKYASRNRLAGKKRNSAAVIKQLRSSKKGVDAGVEQALRAHDYMIYRTSGLMRERDIAFPGGKKGAGSQASGKPPVVGSGSNMPPMVIPGSGGSTTGSSGTAGGGAITAQSKVQFFSNQPAALMKTSPSPTVASAPAPKTSFNGGTVKGAPDEKALRARAPSYFQGGMRQLDPAPMPGQADYHVIVDTKGVDDFINK